MFLSWVVSFSIMIAQLVLQQTVSCDGIWSSRYFCYITSDDYEKLLQRRSFPDRESCFSYVDAFNHRHHPDWFPEDEFKPISMVGQSVHLDENGLPVGDGFKEFYYEVHSV